MRVLLARFPMRIGIDARMFGPRQGGLGRYIEQLILHLEQLNPTAEFVIFLRKENWDSYTPSRPNFEKVLADIPWYGLAEQLLLPRLLKKYSLDLMHFPHWNVPLFYNDPFVVTIHDLLLLHYPTREASTLGPFSYFLKQLGFKNVLRHAARRAKKIITISQYSKQDLESTLGVPPQKIAITYPAPLPPRLTDGAAPDFGITKPYALYVGVAYPHKNLAGLLEAWEIFSEHNSNNQLVLVGKRNFFYDQLIKKFAHLFSSKKVIFTDFVPDDQLAALYQKAALYVFPSFYEGFGMPPLEAMCYGVPVAASNATCLPEILGDSALYFDPAQKTSLVAAFTTGFTDENLRKKLIAKEPEILAHYSWSQLAQKTWELYKNSV